MAFTLDTPSGKGSKTVKIYADSNTEGVQKTAQLLVQVNGVTKQVVQLVQKADSNYMVFIQTNVNQVGAVGGNVRVTYWVTLNGDMLEDLPKISGTNEVIDSGTDRDGKHWLIDKLPVNFGSVEYTASFKSVSAKATVTQKPIKVHLVVDDSYIPGEGGFTNLRYWYEDGSEIGSSGLELIFNSEESDQGVQYTLGTPSTDSTGKIVRKITLPANTVNVIKTLKFYAKYSLVGTVSDTIELVLAGKDMTILPDFDFFVFNCEWSRDNGEDFDSATMVLGSHIPIDGDKQLDDYFVGYGGNGNDVKAVQSLIRHVGDNTQSGVEGALINWKEICNRDLISQGITKLQAKIYGNWYELKGDGYMKLIFKTYKGTGMEKNGYVFVPKEGTELVSESSYNIPCLAFSSQNASDIDMDITKVKDFYSLLSVIEYDVATKYALIYPNLSNSGRSIESYITVSDGSEEKVIYFNGDGLGSLENEVDAFQLSPVRLSFLSSKEIVKTVGQDQNINVVEHDIKVLNHEVYSDQWLTVQTINTDLDGNITEIEYMCEDNKTGVSRNAFIYLDVGKGINEYWERKKYCRLTLFITQKPIYTGG